MRTVMHCACGDTHLSNIPGPHDAQVEMFVRASFAEQHQAPGCHPVAEDHADALRLILRTLDRALG